MATETKNELVSVREAAKECGRNMETIRRWIWGGKLPAEKLGNQLFIKRSDLASFCRETAVREYKAESKPDFLERAIALRKRMKARGVKPINAGELIRQMREERMNELEQRLH
ncbi:MAG: 17 protein [Dehalococcoidales bacterium]|nr:17 protein [Dehalococcoidales bacterium]